LKTASALKKQTPENAAEVNVTIVRRQHIQ
jgi:hypothetical protein